MHLDSPLRGLEANPDAPADRIRSATRRALVNLVDYALREKLDFVVAAGDLYDGDWQDWRTGQFLVSQIARLSNAGIPFVAIRGNHDAESVITRRLRMPHETAALLGTRRPETIRLPDLPVSIHGQSFATKAVTANLARDYPAAELRPFQYRTVAHLANRAGRPRLVRRLLDRGPARPRLRLLGAGPRA